MNGKNSNAQKYANTDTLNEWSKELEQINGDAVGILNKFFSEISELENSWKGNASLGFVKAFTNILNIGKNYHNGMRDTDTFLNTVANHMEER